MKANRKSKALAMLMSLIMVFTMVPLSGYGTTVDAASDGTDAYAPVIDEYKDLLTRIEGGEEINTSDLSQYGYKYVYKEIAEFAVGKSSINGFQKEFPQYAIVDTNGDGIDELIIGGKYDKNDEKCSIEIIYSMDTRGRIFGAISRSSFLDRGQLILYDDGVIQYGESDGADYYNFEFYRVNIYRFGIEPVAYLRANNGAYSFKGDWNGNHYFGDESISAIQFGLIKDSFENKDEMKLFWNAIEIEKISEGYVNVTYNPTMAIANTNTITGFYTDDFFSRSNDEYDKELAQFSLLVTMASMSAQEDTRVNRDNHIKELFNKLGFNNYLSQKYNVPLDNDEDTVGYAFATKQIDKDRVMAVAIRSGYYGNEWGSNARVGELGPHAAFHHAASAVYNQLKDYVDKNDIDKIWICGYSRGGAVSNILGHLVNENNLVSDNDLYCYTFELPKTATGSLKSERGIYNTIALADPIPQVPLSDWGFNYYGHNMYLSNSFMQTTYSETYTRVAEEFQLITGNKMKRGSFLLTKGALCILHAIVGTRADYHLKWEVWVSAALKKFMGKGEEGFKARETTDEGLSDVIKVLGWSNALSLTDEDYFFMLQQHWPELNYAWLKYNTPTERKRYKVIAFSNLLADKNSAPTIRTFSEDSNKDKTFRLLVYDSDNNVVADMNSKDLDSFIQNHPERALDIGVSYDDKLQILLPADGSYHFELRAEDDLSIDYDVSEYENVDALSRDIVYNDIQLEAGESLEGDSQEGIGISASSYNLSRDNGSVIGYDRVLSGDRLKDVTINTETEGNGFAVGAGEYPTDTKVTLRAIPDDNSVFIGWYSNGEKVSSDGNYRLTIREKGTLKYTAVFKTPIKKCAVKPKLQSVTYNGREQTPPVIVSYLGRTLKEGTDYTLSYRNNVNVGTATAIVTGINAYSGSISTTFTIEAAKAEEPKEVVDLPAVKIGSVKKGKKSFAVKWKKPSKKNLKKIARIEVQYSTSRDFSQNAISKTVNKTKKSLKVKKLKAKTTYYVRIRSVKTVNGVKHVSKWSKVKKVKVK